MASAPAAVDLPFLAKRLPAVFSSSSNPLVLGFSCSILEVWKQRNVPFWLAIVRAALS
jgi:hypothetical protein